MSEPTLSDQLHVGLEMAHRCYRSAFPGEQLNVGITQHRETHELCLVVDGTYYLVPVLTQVDESPHATYSVMVTKWVIGTFDQYQALWDPSPCSYSELTHPLVLQDALVRVAEYIVASRVELVIEEIELGRVNQEYQVAP